MAHLANRRVRRSQNRGTRKTEEDKVQCPIDTPVRIASVFLTASDLACRLLSVSPTTTYRRNTETWETPEMPNTAAWFAASSELPAFISGPDGTLTGWNEATERLLQVPADEVLGKSCHEVVAGRDQFGNVYCGRNCPIRRMARRGISIFSFRLEVADAAGECLPFNISIVVVDGGPDRGPSLVHLLEPLFEEPDQRLEIEDRQGPRSPSTRRIQRLTAREVEVLRMIGTGAATIDCAAALGISKVTVRNHVQSCLRKLDAHNRIEAVRLAERLGFFNGSQIQ